MGMFLNSIEPYDKYKTITKGFYFVDKTELLEELIPALEHSHEKGTGTEIFLYHKTKAFWKNGYGEYDSIFF